MSKQILLLINTCDRWYTLKLCLAYLEKFDHSDFTIIILDHASCKSEHVSYISSLKDLKRYQVQIFPANKYRKYDNFRCGLARHNAIELWLNHYPEYEWMFMMDDDILLDPKIILDTANLYIIYKELTKLGLSGATPFCMLESFNYFTYKTRPVAKYLTLGGEGHVLFNRDDILKMGHEGFGPFYKGYGDVHWSSGKHKGFEYITLMDTPAIQHIGVGSNGSVIKRPFVPYWVTEPYRYHGQDKGYIQIPFVDIDKFAKIASTVSCQEACNQALISL